MKLGKLGKTGKFTGDWKSHEKLKKLMAISADLITKNWNINDLENRKFQKGKKKQPPPPKKKNKKTKPTTTNKSCGKPGKLW